MPENRRSRNDASSPDPANEDLLIVASHNGTHIDALSHVCHEGRMYNGFPASTFSANKGASRCGIEKHGGFAGRALLLDVARHRGVDWLEPGEHITGDELEACRAAEGIEINRGDILLVRTGWLELFATLSADEVPRFAQPGLDCTTIPFVRDHNLSVVGADNAAIEVIPFDTNGSLHVEMLLKLGVPFLEHLKLAEMGADHCSEALLVVAPLLFTGAAGSPINPIAIG